MSVVVFEENKIVIPNKVNYKSKFSGMDSVEHCLDTEWFKNYPVQDFDYNYNSWGFRGENYEQYLGKPVIICLGDSFTVNIGGPIEHSWSSLLQKYFNISCLNFGVDGCGNDTIRLIYDNVCKMFDVKECFVVYSFFDRRLENGKLTSTPHDYNDNIKYFEQHFINDVFYQFIPPYCFTNEELNYINNNYNNKPEDYVYFNEYWEDGIDRKYVLKNNYNNLCGSDWPSYEEFLSGAPPHNDVLSGEFKLFLHYDYINCRNRDKFHLNLKHNQKLANNLYQQYINLTRGDVK